MMDARTRIVPVADRGSPASSRAAALSDLGSDITWTGRMNFSNGSLAGSGAAPLSANHGADGLDESDSPAILVVDDEPFIVDVIAFLLEDEGFQVLRAYDGEQAWRMVRERCPDLIISDVYMPRLNGVDLLNRLRQRPPLAHVPVILMSAVRRDLSVPNAAFLSKPFDLDRVLSLVHTELAAH